LAQANFPCITTYQKQTPHQYGISAPIPQISFHWETSAGVGKCPLFSWARREGGYSQQDTGFITLLLPLPGIKKSCLSSLLLILISITVNV